MSEPDVLWESSPGVTAAIDALVACTADCEACEGTGWVCEDHPDRAWHDGEGCCGGAGMACLKIPNRHVILGG